jgi:hypothetical protein
MHPCERIVTQMPLKHLWNTRGELRSSRVRSLALDDLRTLLPDSPYWIIPNALIRARALGMRDAEVLGVVAG